MTICLDRLERAGYVRREMHESDRRGRVIHLTDAGKQLVDVAVAARFSEANDAVRSLTRANRLGLEKLLRQLAAGLNEEPVSDSGLDSSQDSGPAADSA